MGWTTTTLYYWGSSLVVGTISGLIPLVNIEVYLLAVAALAPRQELLPLVVLTTVGQMGAKWLLYLMGAGLLSPRLLGRRTAKLAELKRRLERAPTTATTVVFTSAVIGLPPFYLVSVVAGALRMPVGRFLVVGGCGRLLRFALLVSLPQLLGAAS